uniref:Uncharacterized protein n=1 Tax=Meloidogyne enterolobii TaxID=390850 RepID=A0A6V7TYM7_MELEN|nr:unnamed protein product [Meloidogyne enterolobii]
MRERSRRSLKILSKYLLLLCAFLPVLSVDAMASCLFLKHSFS